MGRAVKVRVAGAAIAAAVVVGSLITAGGTSGAAAPAAACGVLFDDFDYSSHTDGNLGSHGWQVRSNAGGPGVPGATWAPENVTFPSVNGDKVMQLASSTDGTAAGTKHTEVLQGRQRFLEGTYASRIRFSDAPTSGPDGDHVNQTFFTISPLRYDNDPLYSELDFSEYLPNGGWGEAGPINYQTTWYTYVADPWYADNVHSEQRRSFDGWHDLVIQVANGHIVYFIDGVQVGDHSGKVYPRQTMTINWNLWFIDTAAHTGGMSTYQQQVDWVLFAKNQVLSPSQATAQAAAYRSAGNTFTDTVGSSGACSGPTAPPTTQPPSSGNCSTAPEWSIGSVYTAGQTVKHERSKNGDPSGPASGDGKHLWRAKWWTQGSEPGWTANWEDLGRC